jgi:hypothetical protein
MSADKDHRRRVPGGGLRLLVLVVVGCALLALGGYSLGTAIRSGAYRTNEFPPAS